MYNFKLEGTFTERPVLSLEGVTIPYKTLSAVYYPEEQCEGGVLPEMVSLQFSLSSKIGNLESNTFYRVKANKDGQLTFEQLPAEVRDALQQFVTEARKQPRCADCGKPMKDGKCGCKSEGKKEECCAKCGGAMKEGKCTGKCSEKTEAAIEFNVFETFVNAK